VLKASTVFSWIFVISAIKKLQTTLAEDAAEKSVETAISIMESARTVLGF
jgi:hypothetical protein